MSAPDAFLTGDELLAAVTEAMVAFHLRYHHRKPVTAKSLMLGDDLLACVLGGVYTDAEKTMIEIQRTTMVQETRKAFQTPCRTSSSKRSSASPVVTCWRSSLTITSALTSKSSYFYSPPTGLRNRTALTPREGFRDQRTRGRSARNGASLGV
jgi:hypothetical protein